MKFAAVIEYIQDRAKIQELRPTHRQYLTSLLQKGQLAAAGPFLDDFGALIVYEANSRDEAEQFLKADPFNQNGIFVSWVIRPWNTVMAKKDLLPG